MQIKIVQRIYDDIIQSNTLLYHQFITFLNHLHFILLHINYVTINSHIKSNCYNKMYLQPILTTEILNMTA